MLTRREKLGYIVRRWRAHTPFLIFLGALTIISSAAAVAYPYALKVAIDEVERALRTGSRPRLGTISAVMVAVIAARIVANFYPAFRAWVNSVFELDIRAEVFERLLEKDHRFFRAFRTGDVVTRLTEDIGEHMKIAWFLCSGIFRAIESGGKAVFCIGTMLYLEPRLALASIAPLPLTLLVFYAVQRRITDAIGRQQAAISRTNEHLDAALRGIKILKAFSAEDGQALRLSALLDARIPLQLRVSMLFAGLRTTDGLSARLGQVMALALGGVLVARGEVALGTLYAFYMYLDMLAHPLRDLPHLLVTARTAYVSLDRVEELARFPTTFEPEGPGAAPPVEPIEAMSVRDLAVAYDGSAAPAIDGVSFALRAGERLAVVGAVGSGKSTLLRAVAGLLVPARGEVALNARTLHGAAWRAARARLGYVPQDAQLFSVSIAENVSWGRAGEEAVSRALSLAQLDEDLARLERGAETVLGDKGSLISGGQRQRVAIARALAPGPDLLLLDDATAALDARLEDRFWSALDRERPRLLTIVSSHRLATVRRATRVLFLERGRAAACDTHEALMARSQSYRELFAHEATRR